YYKQENKSLYDAVLELYSKYGYYKEGLGSIAFKGKEGMESMRSLINNIRQNPIPQLNGVKVLEFRDYLNYNGVIPLPRENMICFVLEDKSQVCIRPSGTEPKLKLYYAVIGSSLEDSDIRLQKLKEAVLQIIES
ncbi:MAG: phospho-sugar mutase, partial [Clostridia bacterium]|nr:phospho-sugar mutase [Clostridia bacterium]